MVRKKGAVFFKFISTIFLIVLFEAGSFAYSYFLLRFSNRPIIPAIKTFFSYSPFTREFIFSQAILISLIIFIIIVKKIVIQKKKTKRKQINLTKITRGSGTSLDALYKILTEKKSLNINFIANLFEIKKDLAMEWARILEAGGLATLDYPGIGAPRLVLKEKSNIEQETKTDKTKKTDKESPEKSQKESPPPQKKLEKKKEFREEKMTKKKKKEPKQITPKKVLKKSKTKKITKKK